MQLENTMILLLNLKDELGELEGRKVFVMVSRSTLNAHEDRLMII